MRILAIEDDDDFQATLRAAVELEGTDVRITFARTTEAALQSVRDPNTDWDIVVCDLKLPSADGAVAEVEHGMAAYALIAAELPGTPIRILSAFGTFEIASKVGTNARQDDPFGEGSDRPMVRVFAKSQVPELAVELQEMARASSQLDRIEVATGAAPLLLTRAESQALRVYARRHSGAVVKVRALTGGLSKSKTLRVVVEDEHGARTSTVVAKLGTIARVDDERTRYAKFIAPRLGATAFAPMATYTTAGAGNIGGLFYSVAEPAEPLFDLVASDPSRAATIARRLEEALKPWRDGVPSRPTSIRDIRRSQIRDEQLPLVADHVGAIPWERVEELTVQARTCVSHGDLHGGNVLVIAHDEPILIDYGRTGPTSVAIDPVMLEMSLALHPSGQAVAEPWPTEEQAERWDDLGRFTSGYAGASFVNACREWAYRVAAGDREVWASAYAYAMRQLMFDRTNRNLARAILRDVVSRLLEN